jgi:hypothetical protein
VNQLRFPSVPFLTLSLLATPALAQGPAVQSPGLSPYSQRGQTTRFSTEFNPAIGAAIDGFFDFEDLDFEGEEDGDDGFDVELRLLEVNLAAYVDPNVWGYVVLTSEGGEAPEVEEAAVEYIGSSTSATVKAGRFFVDFGKQMQHHLEELRTLERPLVLREYLGEELAGTGVQLDWWTPLGDKTPFRVSVGAFGSLLSGHGHGEEEEQEAGPTAVVPENKALDEFSLAARATVLHELNDRSTLQFGGSARFLPEFSFESGVDGVDDVEGLSNTVYGLDLTYGWTGETGERRFTAGAEYLLYDGDLAAEFDDPDAPTAVELFDHSLSGAFLFADYAWNRQWSAGVQYSFAELPEGPDLEADELDLYTTWHLTEFRRLRLGTVFADSDEGGESARVYLQFTAFFGSHAHGLEW